MLTFSPKLCCEDYKNKKDRFHAKTVRLSSLCDKVTKMCNVCNCEQTGQKLTYPHFDAITTVSLTV